MESTPGIGKVDLSSQISVMVARKALDMQKQQGDAALELLKAASEVQDSHGEFAGDGQVDVYG